ncbi:MAG: DNA alkylation repair protein [Patescibacteria group bacterium]
MYKQVVSELKSSSSPKRAQQAQRFFKTGKGEYGEGDVFIGLTMPEQRKIAKAYFKQISFVDIEKLLQSKIHEYRMVGLVMLVYKFQKVDEKGQKKIYDFYIKNIKAANNWDLVDVTVQHVIGAYLQTKKERKILYKYAKSKNLWKQRVAIIASGAFIKNNDFKDTLAISTMLLNHEHDLIHKAVGWMLREIGKQDRRVLEGFLAQHYKTMPRTMLRYAIEKFPETKRKKYLHGTI